MLFSHCTEKIRRVTRENLESLLLLVMRTAIRLFFILRSRQIFRQIYSLFSNEVLMAFVCK